MGLCSGLKSTLGPRNKHKFDKEGNYMSSRDHCPQRIVSICWILYASVKVLTGKLRLLLVDGVGQSPSGVIWDYWIVASPPDRWRGYTSSSSIWTCAAKLMLCWSELWRAVAAKVLPILENQTHICASYDLSEQQVMLSWIYREKKFFHFSSTFQVMPARLEMAAVWERFVCQRRPN